MLNLDLGTERGQFARQVRESEGLHEVTAEGRAVDRADLALVLEDLAAGYDGNIVEDLQSDLAEAFLALLGLERSLAAKVGLAEVDGPIGADLKGSYPAWACRTGRTEDLPPLGRCRDSPRTPR